MRIFLAWQPYGHEGKKHLRRYDADNADFFMGFQIQDEKALQWMKDNNDPHWPKCKTNHGLFGTQETEPFEEIK